MEFVSLGGLVPGLSADDIKSGISQPRNRHMAEIFHRLNYIESYGTGIRRIFALYESCPESPKIEITTGTFKMILPNTNQEKAAVSNEVQAIKKQWQTVLDYLTEHDEMTAAELQTILNIKRTRTYTLAKEMEKAGLIIASGRGESKKYRLKQESDY